MRKNLMTAALWALSAAVVFLPAGCGGGGDTECLPRGWTVTGGGSADGKDLHQVSLTVFDRYERITIHITEAKWDPSEKTEPAEVIPYYSIVYEEYPARLVCVFNGIRKYSASFPDCEGSRLVGSLEKMMVLDDQAVAFAAVLRECATFRVSELKDPARIVIELEPASGCPDTKVWSLRTEGMLRGEMIGHFQERLMHLGGGSQPRELHCEGGSIVEEGLYESEEDAQRRRTELLGQGIELTVEQRGMFDRPKIGERQDG